MTSPDTPPAPDERALLAALRDRPRDHAALRALALWYLRRLDARGVEIAETLGCWTDAELDAMWEQGGPIPTDYRRAWVPTWVEARGAHVGFYKRVPERLALPPACAAEVTSAELDLLPSVSTLEFRSALTPRHAPKIAQWPGLERFSVFNHNNHPSPAPALASLLASPHLGNLHTLRLLDMRTLTLDVFRALADNPALCKLACLRLGGSAVNDDACRALAASHARGAMTELDVRGTRVTSRGVASLARLPNLRVLGLVDTRLSPRALLALGDCATLEVLDVSMLRWTEARGRAMLSGVYPRLHTLHVMEHTHNALSPPDDPEHARWVARLRQRWPQRAAPRGATP